MIFSAAVGLLFVSSGVTMAVPFALGRVIDVIYSMDQAKDNTDKKRQFEQNLKTLCMALTGIFIVGKKEKFGREMVQS